MSEQLQFVMMTGNFCDVVIIVIPSPLPRLKKILFKKIKVVLRIPLRHSGISPVGPRLFQNATFIPRIVTEVIKLLRYPPRPNGRRSTNVLTPSDTLTPLRRFRVVKIR